MNTSVWLPPLIVLGIGIVAGLFAAWRVRAARSKGPSPEADLRLEITDLEGRRDELYRRLDEAKDEELSTAQVSELETAAARTLRDLDRARAKLGKDADTKPAPAPAPRRGSVMAGFAAGVATSGLIAVLVYWAVRDAKPDPQRMAMEAERAAANQARAAADADTLPPMVVQQVEALEARLAASPDDVTARKDLALTLLAAGQYAPAYEHAAMILQQLPGDPDGLFIHGVVRLAMGQNAESIQILDRVLEAAPEHVEAQLYKGIALVRAGQQEAALTAWQTGLAAAGGSHRELEQLIEMIESGAIQAPAPPAAEAAGSDSVLVWQAPESWREETPTSPMRRAQYRVPGPDGDGQLVVFYFGTGQGGDAMANARRWADQFRQEDGRASSEVMTTRQRTVGEMPVLIVEVEGTYTGGMSGAPELPGAMLLGAIARGPDANWFFKLTGPRATIESQRQAFDAFVGSLRSASAS